MNTRGATNNKYFNCPPRMDDARHFTDYRPECYVNNLIRMNSGILGSHEYRQYLIKNANKLMDANRQHAQKVNGCGPCDSRGVPYYNQCTVDIGSNLQCRAVSGGGIGTRWY